MQDATHEQAGTAGGTAAARGTRCAGVLLMLDFANRRVLVLGLGDTGLSMARWLVRRGAVVHVADTRSDPPHAGVLARELPRVGLTRGTYSAADFARADAIAISPGIDRREPAV